MMQQMMSNPQMMQESMQMAQAMMGNNTPGYGGAIGGANPMAPNPMSAMIQQMMAAPPAAANATGDAADAPVPAATELNPMVRARFASQLSQLSVMGFCNEQACLRALLQHQGRVDAAIDTLLSSPDGSA
jgi:hypothetical protein